MRDQIKQMYDEIVRKGRARESIGWGTMVGISDENEISLIKQGYYSPHKIEIDDFMEYLNPVDGVMSETEAEFFVTHVLRTDRFDEDVDEQVDLASEVYLKYMQETMKMRKTCPHVAQKMLLAVILDDAVQQWGHDEAFEVLEAGCDYLKDQEDMNLTLTEASGE